MREIVDKIERVLIKDADIRLQEDYSSAQEAAVYVNINGKGYEIKITRAEAYDNTTNRQRINI